MTKAKPSSSIRRQLLLWLILPLGVLSLFSTVIAYHLTSSYADATFDGSLLSAAHNIAARLKKNEHGIVADLPEEVEDVLRHDDRDEIYYQILDTTEQRIAGDALIPQPNSNALPKVNDDEPVFFNSQVEGKQVRAVRIQTVLPTTSRTIIVQVARTQNARTELIGHIFWSIVIPQVALITFSIMAVVAGVRHGLQPLQKLRDEIQNRSQFDLKAVEVNNVPDELLPLIGALNNLLIRLAEYVDAQQRFVANAAHQLRTPVAGLKAYIEYGRRVDKSKINEVLDQLDNGTDRISEMVAGLLILARAANSTIDRDQLIDLNNLASEVCSNLVHEATNKNIELSFCGCERPAIVNGDAAELREMVSNLVVNAVRYTQENGRVNVQISNGDARAISILDNGPGIPEAERKRVFERFYRILGSKVNGSGLGLAIVHEIATAHNAQVDITDGLDGRGTAVRVVFPEAVQ